MSQNGTDALVSDFEKLKLPEDKVTANKLLTQESKYETQHRDFMLSNGVEISKELTPDLEKSLSEVCDALRIKRQQVKAFVYANSELQADCHSFGSDHCVIRFSSALVNLLDIWEFKFVAGHEVGHFILGHLSCNETNSKNSSFESLLIQRSRELSADRIGYLACGSLEESVQAMMKVASGLTETNLRLDIARFIAQLNQISEGSFSSGITNTHPALIIRARSLVWLSTKLSSIEEIGNISQLDLKWVNQRVLKDLAEFVDGGVRKAQSELKEEILVLKLCCLIAAEGKLTKPIQNKIIAFRDKSYLDRIINMLTSYDSDAVIPVFERKLSGSLEQLRRDFPISARDIENEVFEEAYGTLSD